MFKINRALSFDNCLNTFGMFCDLFCAFLLEIGFSNTSWFLQVKLLASCRGFVDTGTVPGHAHHALCSFRQTDNANDLFCSSRAGFLPVLNGKSSTDFAYPRRLLCGYASRAVCGRYIQHRDDLVMADDVIMNPFVAIQASSHQG